MNDLNERIIILLETSRKKIVQEYKIINNQKEQLDILLNKFPIYNKSDIQIVKNLLSEELVDFPKEEQDNLILPLILSMYNSSLSRNNKAYLDKLYNLIKDKDDSLKDKINDLYNLAQKIVYLSLKLREIPITDIKVDEISELFSKLRIYNEKGVIDELFSEIMKANSIRYNLRNKTNIENETLREIAIQNILENYGFNIDTLEEHDKLKIISNYDLLNIGLVLSAIKNNKLKFLMSKRKNKYVYSNELVQLILYSSGDIINDVCNTYLSLGGEPNNLVSLIPAFLDKNDDILPRKRKVSASKDKKELLKRKNNRISFRYKYFKENTEFLITNWQQKNIEDNIDDLSVILLMEPKKLRVRYNILNTYGINFLNQIKSFTKLMMTTSSSQLAGTIDSFIELGFDDFNGVNYKDSIDDNLSKLMFKYAVNKIYYAKKHNIPVFNSKGNWCTYIMNNSAICPSIGRPLTLDEVYYFTPNYVDEYYNNSNKPINNYYELLNNIDDEEFDLISQIPLDDELIKKFASYQINEYAYCFGNIIVSKPKLIRNLKILEDKIDEYNFIDIVLLCITNNSILTEEEFKSLKTFIGQILDSKKKVL